MNKRQSFLGSVICGALFSGLASTASHAIELSEAISQTLTSNPQLLTERREVDARNREVRGAKGGFLPEVNLHAGYGYQELDPAGNLRNRTNLERSESSLSVRQMVFDGFNTSSDYRNQQAREESATHRVSAVAEQLTLDTIEAYLNILKREETLELARDTLTFHQDIYGKMKQRFDSGTGSRADFDQISGRLALANTNFFNAKANLVDARVDFQRLVGQFPADNALSMPSGPAHLPSGVEEAIARAVENHPIMRVANADVEAVNQQYKQTKNTFYPHLSVEVEKALDRNIDGIRGEADDLQVMLKMRYNLYSGGSDTARKQQFAHLVDKAREIRNNARRQVEQEVRLAWVALETLQEQIPSLESHVQDASSTRSAYFNQYDLGRRTLLDLLNTENESVGARQTLISARHDLIYNEYRILQAMGGLLNAVGAEL